MIRGFASANSFTRCKETTCCLCTVCFRTCQISDSARMQLHCSALIFCLVQTGKLWSELEDYETAETCYARAMEYAQFLLDMCSSADTSQSAREECAMELFGLYLDRTAVAWHLQQKVAFNCGIHYAVECITSLSMNKCTRYVCLFGCTLHSIV